NEHGPAARTMLKRILDDDPQRHSEALQAAESTLRARIDLWDATVGAFRLGLSDRRRDGGAAHFARPSSASSSPPTKTLNFGSPSDQSNSRFS
ncbi:MAG: DUF3050 domain-containing protein, partial [Planctomycetota bacterium]